jgi:hypothetical protein
MITIFKIAITTIFKSLLTEKFAQWLILYLADMLVKSTKNTMDDELLKKIKESLK